MMAVLVTIAALALGCAGPTKQGIVSGTYKALSIGGNSYDAAMTGIGDLYRQGLVTEEQKAEAIKVGNYYHDAYHAAVESLKTYAGTDVETGDLQQKVYAVGTALGKLLAYINPLLSKYGMEVVK
jgi:hypothetical protein